jgi:8-oxo-dGTP pyrophosphatase MutT (NUDIX family)
MTLARRLRESLDIGHGRAVDLHHADSNVAAERLDWKPAAVLIAITDRSEPGIILTQRPDTMRSHPGQVAFPGGRVDTSDADAVAAALREANEEVGLPYDRAEIVGTTDRYRTITGYHITPVIAVVPPDLPLIGNEEVTAIFEPPLSFLLDPANHQKVRVDWNGAERHYFELHWQDRRIWGATAAMIVNLSRRLSWLG